MLKRFYLSVLSVALALMFFSNAFAQNMMDISPSASNIRANLNVKHNIDSPIDSQWDVEFNYDAFTVTGANGNAGAVYIPTLGKFWTSRWATTAGNAGVIHEWNTNGTLNATYTLSFTGTRGMCFDGTNVYHSTNTTTVQKVDPTTRLVVGTVSVVGAPNGFRFITYNPDGNAGAGSIIGGNWTAPNLNFYEFSLTGTLLRTITNTVTGVYGIAYDKWSAGGPYLWVWSQGTGGPQYMIQMDYTTGLYTGVQKDVKNDVGINQPGAVAGGMFITNQLIAGEVTMGGILQGAPDLFFGYEIVSSAPQGPGYAITPTPVNAAIGVTVNTTLSWVNPAGATSNAVWFGTSPATLTQIHSGSLVTSVPRTGLLNSTRYFWRVDETGATGTTTGTLWSFTTEAAVLDFPIVEDFEDGVFPPTGWSLSTGTIWKSSEYYLESQGASGYGVGSYSAFADFYVVASGSQHLISPQFNMGGAQNPVLSFDWAYATYSGELDELDIYYSTDAGTTWTILLAMPGGLNGILNPFHLVVTDPYFPANNEWSTQSLALPAGTNKIRFTAITANGNWVFLDNIGISDQFFDNFDSYTTGLRLCGQTTNWQTWSGPTGTAEDPFVSSTYANSPANSVRIIPDNDLVRVNGTKTSGVWYMSWMTYIPTGKTGYFNTLSDFAGAASEFAMQATFGNLVAGQGQLDAGGSFSAATFFFPYDDWFQVWLKVDLDADLATLRINGSLVYTWQYTLGTQPPNIALQLEANDFYGIANSEMFIDDYYFSAIAPPIQLLPADAGMVSIDLGIAIAPGSQSPQATVRNFGGETQTFPVTMTIGTYSSTQTVTALAPDATAQVTFAPWNAVTGGPLTVDVCTELVGDLNNPNNCLSQPLYVWDDSGVWANGDVLPDTTYLGTGVSWIETTADATIGHLFSLGGVGSFGVTKTSCYDYNVNTNTWTVKASMPGDRDRFASATVGDFIIAMGGYPEAVSVPSGSVFKYDIIGNSWSTVAPLLTGEERGWHKAVSYNNYVYVAGGITGDICATCTAFEYESSVLVYNVTANTWATATSMPGARFGGAFTISGNQLIYIGGASPDGIENTVFVGTINAGDPTIINWTTQLNLFPGAQNKSYLEYSADLVRSISNKTNPKEHSRLVGGNPAGPLYRFDAAPWGTNGVIVTTGAPGGFVPSDPNYCFVYYPGTDTWTAQENLQIPVVGSSLGTVNDGNTWKLIVAGGNDGSFGLKTTQIYTQTVGGALTFPLTVETESGWNMVSIPGLHPVDQNVGTWWAYKEVGSKVYKFNSGYLETLVATPGEGYWMKNTVARTYNTGEEWPSGGIQIVTHTPIPGNTGWNMIGGYENPATIANITTDPPNQKTGIVYGYTSGYTTPAQMTPGDGYWVKLLSNADIIIPETLAKDGKAVEYFPENWGRIILTDATGVSYTLYAVKGEVDLNLYELPPAPPAGMFDIRFGSGRIAENLNSSIQTIDMSGVVYPLTVRVEGMDIRLQDATGKQINANLKSGEDVVISDATIQKLMVSGESIPTVYALEQNYPNPFNPSTMIEFSLPEDVGNVKLSIYNALGEKVAELVNTALTAGKYQYQWNAQNVATGMYIYELRTDNFVSVKKMLLLK